jgi:2-oxoglutarate ferredoxin oxidoreductase subunit beta
MTVGVDIDVIDKYMRTSKLPHIWCPGCGNGIVVNALIRAMNNLDLKPEETVIVSGIGCSSRTTGYVNTCGLHSVHGRALAYATGIKMYRPELKVIALMGDGDCTSIGGNHWIHAARRNIDITAVVFNNDNYGMTGGQYSPTTPVGSKTKTSPYGHMEPPFDICNLSKSAGATYVARSTTYHVNTLIKYLENALSHKGFSMVEAICDCPTLYGRMNKKGNPAQMLLSQKERAVPVNIAQTMSEEELRGKVVVGEFINIQRPEYTEQYMNIIRKAQREAQ